MSFYKQTNKCLSTNEQISVALTLGFLAGPDEEITDSVSSSAAADSDDDLFNTLDASVGDREAEDGTFKTDASHLGKRRGIRSMKEVHEK